MKQNTIAALAIFGSFVIVILPFFALASLWRSIGRNESLLAAYLALLAPVGWLVWGICKQRGIAETEVKFLRAVAWLNTALMILYSVCFVVYLAKSCDYGFHHFTAPGS